MILSREERRREEKIYGEGKRGEEKGRGEGRIEEERRAKERRRQERRGGGGEEMRGSEEKEREERRGERRMELHKAPHCQVDRPAPALTPSPGESPLQKAASAPETS